MNDTELANAVVTLGFFKKVDPEVLSPMRILEPDKLYTLYSGLYLSAKHFVRDWRVAGALMEKCGGIYAHNEPHIKGWWAYVETDKAVRLPVTNGKTENESLPRAIIEACVKALQNETR
jgi:hypothetical protein